jgi:asparagine synthase (glutamine-hydrolysing)
VVDLTSAAAQPMRDPDDRATIVYNGELYNAATLRARLQSEGVRFRSRSDTEVVLHALLNWGHERALAEFNGMFALALFEPKDQRLLLARDRFGEKPLYYAVHGGRLVFASEVGALARHGNLPLDLDPEAVELYLTFGWVPAPWSIYRAIRKLPHASYLVARGGDVESGRTDARGVVGAPRRYYRLEERIVAAEAARAARQDDRAAAGAVRAALDAAVRSRLESDVPLGAFLSGGIDSSAVVTMMAGALPSPPRTYSVSIPDSPYFNEGPEARLLATALGARHVDVPVNAARLIEEVPQALSAFGEPFADSSAIPCSVIAAEARRGLTVALSGDGGDEVFGGYRIYRALAASGTLARLPGSGRALLRALLAALPARHGGGLPGLVHRGRRLLDGLASDLTATHAAWMSILDPAARRALRPGIADAGLGRAVVAGRYARFGGGVDRAMAVEMDLSLPDDMLTKVDRTSMRHALEVRAPFLDPALVELSLAHPAAAHFSLRAGKRLLRAALRGVVPDRILDAPKRGFEVPVSDWLGGPLAPAWDELVTPARLEEVAGLDARVVTSWREAHRARRAEHGKALWAIFVLCHWHRDVRPAARVAAAENVIPFVAGPRRVALS